MTCGKIKKEEIGEEKGAEHKEGRWSKRKNKESK